MTQSDHHNLITDIIFDLGKVIVGFDWNITLKKLSQIAPEEVAEFIRRDTPGFMALLADPADCLERGKLSFEEFHSLLSGKLGLDITVQEFRDMWCDIFWPNHDVIRIGRTLAQRYNVHLMSNTSEAHYDWIIRRFPEVIFYRKAALSYQLRCMKPEPEYYSKALALFDSDPAGALFIDDLQENLDGAAFFGIRTIRFEGSENLINRLKEHGVTL